MKSKTLLGYIVFLFVACTQDSFNPASVNEVVVDGCLVAGSLVDSIRLSLLAPYGSNVQKGAPIDSAEVRVSDGAAECTLNVFGDSGYYHSPDTSFLPREDSTYTITIFYNGKTISARTVVPRKPIGLSLSIDTLYIDTTLSIMEMMQQMREDSGRMVFSFDNYDSAYFFVVVENVDSTPVDLQTDTIFFNGPRFLSRPFKSNEYLISFMQIKQLGRHKITLYRVNQEYVDLYDYRNQDSRSLNEPKTNVVNGLGIFTAVSCDSMFFYASVK